MSKYIRRGSVRLQLHATDEKVKQPSQGKKPFSNAIMRGRVTSSALQS